VDHITAKRKVANMMRLPRSTRLILAGLATLGVAAFGANVMSRSYDVSVFLAEKDRSAPTDRGTLVAALGAPAGVASAAEASCPTFGGLGMVPPVGGAGGKFGDVLCWPIIPIHVSLLPDGRVLSYGTGKDGAQGAISYDIWDPTKGVGTDSHTVLANTTKSDIFCGTGSWFAPGLNDTNTILTGKFLSLGGDLTVDNVRNFSNKDVVLFDPANLPDERSLSLVGTMEFPRWYASMTTLPNGSKLLLGGAASPGVGVGTPEIVSPTTGVRKLSEISAPEFQFLGEWYYPRATVGVDGSVNILQFNGKITKLTTGSPAAFTDTGARIAQGDYFYPSVMMPVHFSSYPYLRMLSVRNDKKVQIVDLTSGQPLVKDVASLRDDRKWGNLTLLADGSILMTGGSGAVNQLIDVVKQAQMFWPIQEVWSDAATAAVPRLYHSAALLLPDGSVLTGGGGAPGPQNNLNAEIFYPQYLYNADGSVAPRPTIVSAPSSVKLGETFQLTVGENDTIASVTLARAGYNTHSYDPDARLIYLDFTQNGPTVTGYVRPYPQVFLPGYYMLFAFDAAGHPSIAKMVAIPQAVP